MKFGWAYEVISSHTEDTRRRWHVNSICLQERYIENVIKF